MTDEIRKARDEVAFLKSLAEEDLRSPLIVGIFFQTAGVLAGVFALGAFALEMGWRPPAAVQLLQPWHLALVLVVAMLVRIFLAIRRQPERLRQDEAGMRQSGLASRAMMAGWQAVILGYAVIAISLEVAGIGSPQVYVVVFLALWGGGWTITHSVMRVGWHMTAAFCAYAMAVLFALAAGMAPSFTALAAAIAMFLLFALPGTLILRDVQAERESLDGRR